MRSFFKSGRAPRRGCRRNNSKFSDKNVQRKVYCTSFLRLPFFSLPHTSSPPSLYPSLRPPLLRLSLRHSVRCLILCLPKTSPHLAILNLLLLFRLLLFSVRPLAVIVYSLTLLSKWSDPGYIPTTVCSTRTFLLLPSNSGGRGCPSHFHLSTLPFSFLYHSTTSSVPSSTSIDSIQLGSTTMPIYQYNIL